MTRLRHLGSGLVAATLVALGLAGAEITRAGWVPCENTQTSDLCLATMDQPSHLVVLQGLWLGAVLLGVVALVVMKSRIGRAFAGVALLLVLAMNYVTEYVLWIGFAGGHWDVPPGTGYTQSLAFIVAGLLVGVGTLMSRSELNSSEPVVGDTGLEPMTSSV